MSLPGFSADRAIGANGSYYAHHRHDSSSHAVTPAAPRWHAPAQWFWPCFRNCYNRCGGSGDLHVDMCFGFCYHICDTNPWVVF